MKNTYLDDSSVLLHPNHADGPPLELQNSCWLYIFYVQISTLKECIQRVGLQIRIMNNIMYMCSIKMGTCTELMKYDSPCPMHSLTARTNNKRNISPADFS